MTDIDKITFGVHKGKRLIDVPAGYLLWLLDNNKCYGDLKKYIEDNKQVLQSQCKNGRR